MRPGYRNLCVAVWLSLASAHAVNARTFLVNTTEDAVDMTPGDGRCSTVARKCSLRAAVQESNRVAGVDTIRIPPGHFKLSVLSADPEDDARGDLDILDTVIIEGAGPDLTIIDAQRIDRIFQIKKSPHSDLRLSDVTLQNGSTPNSGGALNNRGDVNDVYLSNVHIVNCKAGFSGGGLFNNAGYFFLEDVTITGNKAERAGGGVATSDEGITMITDSRIEGNAARAGGGVANGRLQIERSVITGNFAVIAGGGVYSGYSSLELTDSVVSGNSAGSRGGGVFSRRPHLISRTSIADNYAGLDAGGAWLNEGLMNRVSIVRNSTVHQGGGLFLESENVIQTSTIAANRSGESGGGIHASLATVDIAHSTIAFNETQGEGAGIYIGEVSSAQVYGTIVSNNMGADNCRILGELETGGYNLSGDLSCLFRAGTDLPGVDPQLLPLSSDSSGLEFHRLSESSPAIDAGPTDCEGVDQTGLTRPQDDNGDGAAACEIGAKEGVGAENDDPDCAGTIKWQILRSTDALQLNATLPNCSG